MGCFAFFVTLLLAVSSYIHPSLAQSSTPTVYTDPDTGIIFDTWIVPATGSGASGVTTYGGLKFGMALPEDGLTTDATEFIGYLQCASNSSIATGWCGISLGGPMTNSLLLMAWPYDGEILTAFLWATGYDTPVQYTGDATLTQISSTVNSTHFTLLFHCQGCLAWDQDGATGSNPTSDSAVVLGWSQAIAAPSNPQCPASVTMAQHEAQSIFGAVLDSNAANPSYSEWAALATNTVTGACGGATATPTTTVTTTGTVTTTSTTATATVSGVPVPTATYDYIIVGGGAGGIPLADKLSEAGKSVLLIEKGPPSSGRWGGTLKPDWLDGTNLTRFDVPGLCNQIWVDSAGIACTDTDQMAGCVLGGGTAVNAGLWWKPNPIDWDYNFPTGWKSTDMSAAAGRVFSRIPGTDHPSMDGTLYLQQGFNVLASGLKAGGWAEITANSVPDQKNHTYAHTPYMFSNGERGGPMATYLVSAHARSNFKLWTDTTVKRVIRTGGHITGVEVEPQAAGGYAGVVNVTPISGRVILSAGTFGSAKLLLRSGIGPADQLAVVKGSSDGPTMISNSSWITLPVGYNLEDHTNTDTVISHPDVVFYDFYEAWDNPNATDESLYMDKRSGILTQAAPNIGPMFWDEISGADGIVRQLQWTARVEGSLGVENGKSMTMSQYLGRGATSRGRMTITNSLNTVVSTLPYLNDKNDVLAVIQGIKNLQDALKNVANLTWEFPDADTSVEDYVNNMLVSYTNRRSNHWIGANKMGTDDGRSGGSAVVDTNTKVYGTDNLFVVDASIFPGHVTTNPSSYIVTVAERAYERISALATATPGAKFAQCDGATWTGSFQCADGLTCTMKDVYYSQCL
ncbi:fungal cellulose binding domain-containing protein [Pseudomassariella vexata]|uniref:Fungal cellulose binding domain-containing protein n=1 Tax=Pseudomassariella vexata TaxID=1141098 RepID=A0A1Y2DZW2_9PEZI|nr:fungal cellulose binding domain-containing protein [Pseudomassariella vexata]ORY64787.1 fungal cellulose binding domain-containing protein [Pseudomassariella vexata]